MVIYAKIIIILNIFLQIHAENKLFSMFHQEIAKRFDRAKSINSEQRLWSDLKNKNAGYFKHGRDIQNSNKGYFIHVVPRDYINARREFTFNRYEGGGSVIGVPSNEWHLPNAEPILPGHTLLRPTLGMLKSAVSFPHLEHDEGGAGVYGNPSQLGIQYGGRSGRVLYSHNRRVFPDNRGMNPKTSDFTSRHLKSKFYLVPVTLDSVKDSDAKKLIVNILNKIKSKYQPRSNYSPNYNIADSALNRNIDERDSTRIVNVRRTPKMSKEMKSKQFWTTKDMFDHIKLSSNKPELSDLMPEDHNKVPRNWWYFNENYNIADSALNRNIDERDSTRIVNVRRTPKMSKEMKSKQFWTTKDMFDHIKLSSNKPELSDLMPEDHNKVPRNWWYFNEDDLSQLQAAL